MPIEKEIYSAKNDLIIDLGIAIEEAYQEALKNGFEGSKDDFIRTAPKSLLRKFINKGGRVRENSYEQLIDDYDNGIRVLTLEVRNLYIQIGKWRNGIEF